MEPDEAGRLKPSAKPQGTCAHERLLDEERGKDGQPTGRLICKECGAAIAQREDRA